MPKREDIKKILIIGSGPAVVGQGAEYDAAAAEAGKALRAEGYEVVMANSNPATISTDQTYADRIYVEPLTVDTLSKIIAKEKPDALIAAFGGQTALYLAYELERKGVLSENGVKAIGISERGTRRFGDPNLFNETAYAAGIPIPKSAVADSMEDALKIVREIGLPVAIRPAFTPGGGGSGVAYNVEEFVGMVSFGLKMSPSTQVLLEEPVIGWKQIELIAARDAEDNAAVVTAIESLAPASVHPGNSPAVSPAQTLDARAMSGLESVAKKAIKAFDIVGAASVKCAVSPSGDVVVLGVDASVGRGAAFASLATGLPIAEASAKLAVGFALAETGIADAGEEADRVAVRVPQFAYEKFPDADTTPGSSMTSVGDAVAIGGSFIEALQMSLRAVGKDATAADLESIPGIDRWFVEKIGELAEFEAKLEGKSLVSMPTEMLEEAKRLGYSDDQLAALLETDAEQVSTRRKVLGIRSGVGTVGSACYLSYSASDIPCAQGSQRKVVLIRAGPSKIGQGSEIDVNLFNAAKALADEGFTPVVVNCEPNAASTSAARSGKLYLAPVTQEDVTEVVDREKPEGMLVTFGGQTALSLGRALAKSGAPIIGTPMKAADRIMSPRNFAELLRKLDLRQMPTEAASSVSEALQKGEKLGFPLLARPGRIHYGRSRSIIYDAEDLAAFVEQALVASPDGTVVMYRFLEDATEVSVDAVADGEKAIICGVMEHIEQAGVHAGDSAASMPPHSLPADVVDEVKRQTRALGMELGIRGLLNVRYAVKDGQVFVLAVNPRASRMVPFVSKATGIDWAGVAAKIAVGKSLAAQGITEDPEPSSVSVKEAVFPFVRFPGSDVVLGPDMKSTGLVMGINSTFGSAYIKAQLAADQDLPRTGTVFLSLADRDKRDLIEIGQRLAKLGFKIVATEGTAEALGEAGVQTRIVAKIGEGRPDAIDLIKNGDIDLIINTRSGKRPRAHEIAIRSAVVARGIPIITTIAGAKATLFGMETVLNGGESVKTLQEHRAQ